MPLSFDDSVNNDLSAVFFNAAEFAQRVTIARGTITPTANVAAIVEVREYEIVAEDGIASSVNHFDFDFIATAYKIGGNVTDPREGDQLTDRCSRVYEILPIEKRKCFEPQDDGKTIRVHAKRVA